MTDKYANLHLHSTHSDAGFRPAHLCCLAKSLGYGAIAVTDHEAISGIPELLACAKNNGLEAMTGVELYAELKVDDSDINPVYHIVGLDFDHTHPSIVNFTDMMTAHRNEHTRRQYESAQERGLFPKEVTWDDIVKTNPGSKWFCNDQVYFALDALGVIPIYKRGETFKEAFKTGEAAKIKIYVPDMQDVINAIREAGGIAVLAHPSLGSFKYIRKLADMGLKGIEASHPHVTEDRVVLAHHAAIEYNLYLSGGTDHTGPMSACGGDRAIPVFNGATQDEFNAIKERRYGN